jgi:hypothetical protein
VKEQQKEQEQILFPFEAFIWANSCHEHPADGSGVVVYIFSSVNE